jgi:hypothetical protein
MADPEPTLGAVEQVLGLVVSSGGNRFHLGVCEGPFKNLSGRGVTIETPDARGVWDESHMDATEQERTPVQVDVLQVLTEGVSAWGYGVVAEGEDCLRLTHSKLAPDKCSILVPLRGELGALALRARFKSELLVSVHFGSPTLPAVDALARALGVFSLRLREVETLDVAALTAAAQTQASALAAFGITTNIALPSSLAGDATPTKVVEYATTAAASEFESATAQILDGLMDLVLPLGSRLAGKPVPDGLAMLEARAQRKAEVALYDCKSKENAKLYSFGPHDGDQFARYGEILKRCEEDGWEAKGVLVATSDADATSMDEKMTKDIWSRLKQRRLIVVPAAVLERWHRLSAAEGPAFRGRIDTEACWRALWDQRLPDGVSEHRFARYFPRRDLSYRVVSAEEGELVWLAGVSTVKPSVATAFTQLQRASTTDRIAAHKKPQIIDTIIRLLGSKKDLQLDELATHVGLTQRATEYVIEGAALGDIALDDIGEHFAKNRGALREAILKS